MWPKHDWVDQAQDGSFYEVEINDQFHALLA